MTEKDNQGITESNTLVKRTNRDLVAKNDGRSQITLTSDIIKSAVAARTSNQGLRDVDWVQKIWIWADECEIDEESIPRNRLDLLELNEIIVEGSKIKSLPESIGNLNQLQYLYISGQNFESLPESIGNLNQLQRLSISGSNFKSLPESIGYLKNLQYLNVDNNNLVSLPESIGYLKNLIYLNVSDNNLKTLPGSLVNLKNIERIEFDGNNFEWLPQSIMDMLRKSEEIKEIERQESVEYFEKLDMINSALEGLKFNTRI